MRQGNLRPFILACFFARVLFAHGPVQDQLDALNKLLERDSNNAELYFKRGELNRVDGNWVAAIADYERARALNPKLDIVDLAIGQAFLEAQFPKDARRALDRFLHVHPTHDGALAARAQAFFKLKDYARAEADFSAALACTNLPRLELYLGRADSLLAQDAGNAATAIRSLDEGILRIGPAVALEFKAVELELQLKHIDSALGRIDVLLNHAERKDALLARRAEILLAGGRMEAAREEYRRALDAITSLPGNRKNARATVQLEEKIRGILSDLSKRAAK